MTSDAAMSNVLSLGAAFLTRVFFRMGVATASSTAAASGTSFFCATGVFLLKADAGFGIPTPGAAVLGGTGILIVEAALAAPVEAAGGTEILIVGDAAGLGGRLMRTVCFLDYCELPAAGG